MWETIGTLHCLEFPAYCHSQTISHTDSIHNHTDTSSCEIDYFVLSIDRSLKISLNINIHYCEGSKYIVTNILG